MSYELTSIWLAKVYFILNHLLIIIINDLILIQCTFQLLGLFDFQIWKQYFQINANKRPYYDRCHEYIYTFLELYDHLAHNHDHLILFHITVE